MGREELDRMARSGESANPDPLSATAMRLRIRLA